MHDAPQVRSFRTGLSILAIQLFCVGWLLGFNNTSQPVFGEPVNASVASSRINQNASAETTSVPRLQDRFANATSDDTPDFQKHVMPLLGRLGCNGRACHGSFQGRGGFQLSLFGYDFKADHEALLEENAGRVDVDDTDESLILAKPTDADMHEGGKLLDKNTWQYNTLRSWIESGAKADVDQALTLERLEIQPKELQFRDDGQQTQLTAIAHWADGTVEDVTALCRFASNDDAVAAIDEDGLVRSGLPGDTHLVVSYDRAVVPIAVTRPIHLDQPIKTRPPESKHPIDQLIAPKLAKLGIVPSQTCTDAEFIRRASLDITGTLPAAADVRTFLADDTTNKRERLVEELLEAPGYAAWWATRMADWTGNSSANLNNALPVQNVASKLWFEWLRVRLDDNVPYDEIVEGIVEAQSMQEDESYTEYCEAMTQACQKGNEDQFAARDGMPLYWARRNFQKPEERAIGFAYAFLGVRIECAQCHKHPFDQWSKDDFEHFAALFGGIQARPNTISKENQKARDAILKSIVGDEKLKGGDLRRRIYTAAKKGTAVPFGELTYVNRYAGQMKRAKQMKKKGKKANVKMPKAYLLGQSEPLDLSQDPRGELMSWLRSPENPYFAKAIVNRVWANYFGIGIINPTDDMNLANPPSNEMLLEKLSSEFRKQGYDLHWLHRMIVTSDAYQRSTETNRSNQQDRTNFSHHVPRRLPAEVVRDAVMLATESQTSADKMRSQLSDMSIAGGVAQNRNNRNFTLQVFGQSERANNCDCDRSDSPSLLQSIYLRNDLDVHQQLDSKQGWVTQACKSLGHQGPGQSKTANLQATKRAIAMHKQTIDRAKRLLSLKEDRRERQYVKAKKAYQVLRKKLAEYGFESPGFDKLLNDPDGWELVQSSNKGPKLEASTLDSVVEDAYLRTLSRYPEEDETQVSVAYIRESDTVADGLASLMWALVNTKEFIITH